MDRTDITARYLSSSGQRVPYSLRGRSAEQMNSTMMVYDHDVNIGAGYMIKDGTYNRYHQVFSFYSGIYVIQGKGAFISAEGERHEIGPGCFFQRIPNREHTTLVFAEEPWHEVFLNLPANLYHALCQCGLLCPKRDVLHPGKQEHWLQEVKEYIKALSCCPSYAVPSMVAHAIALLQRIVDEDRMRFLDPREQQMEKALALLCENLDAPLTIREIAEAVGIGYEAFRKQFKARYGMPPAQYRIARRIELSQRFLKSGNHVKNVALMLGYCDEFAFSKQFKKKTAVTPREYGRAEADEAAADA